MISRGQLVALGWSNSSVDRRVDRGVLKPLWPSVYAYGHAALTREGWWMAATLACGDGSHLAARASGAARGLMAAWSTIDVITPRKAGLQLPGIRAHRARLRTSERDVFHGLPVTSLARTALDVAATEPPDRVGELLDRALLDGQYDHGEMRELLSARRGCRGMAVLRVAVTALGDSGVVFRSRPERLARDLIRASGLGDPRVNAWFPTRAGHGYELDLFFPACSLDVEIDGPQHALPHQRESDARRDADLRNFGVRVVRIAHSVVTEQPAVFVASVQLAVESR